MHLILKLNSSLPLGRFGLTLSILDDALRGLLGRMNLGFSHVFTSQEPADNADYRHHKDYYDPHDCHHLDITIPLPHALSRFPTPKVCEDLTGHQKSRTNVRPMNFYTMTSPYRGAAHTDEPTAYRQSPRGYFPRYLSLRL
jgi:hypothetical protein